MRINRLFCPQLPVSDVPFELPEKQASYLNKVLRLKTNDTIHLFNGQGLEYAASILSSERRRVIVKLGEMVSNQSESPLTVELGQVLSRGDRMDFAIQKSVELGVSSITPLFSKHCEVRLDPGRLTKRRHHWQQIVYSACEQCGRTITPEIHEPLLLSEWLTATEADVKIIFHPSHKQLASQARALLSASKPDKVAVLIGPEGGFSDQEVTLAQDKDFIPLTLGPRILRTETAPVVALAFLQQRWGDFEP